MVCGLQDLASVINDYSFQIPPAELGGATVPNLAKVNAATGANNASFALQPAGRMFHIELVRDAGGTTHPLAGRYTAP